jgi:hypothetical protein
MVRTDIVNWIIEGKKRGHSVESLRRKLIDSGFSRKEVGDAVNSLNFPKEQEEKIEVPEVPPQVREKVEAEAFEGKKLGIFSKIGKAFASPNDLFRATKAEGVWPALKYYWTVLLVPMIITSVFLYVAFQWILSQLVVVIGGIEGAEELVLAATTEMLPYIIGGVVIFTLIVMPILAFVFAGIFHVFIKAFRGQGRYADTFKAGVYSSTPSTLFGWVPFLNFLFMIWSFILSIFGIASYHKISKGRAFLSILTTVVALGLLVWIVTMLVPLF